jgi:uncharacterized protein YutE (UPF0331/DUF86 family)
LQELSACSFEEHQENFLIHRATERLLHPAVEACLDIGNHIIASEGFRAPQDNQDVFRVLAEEGVVPAALEARLMDMARFRNLIVHDDARIDPTIVYGILQRRLGDFDDLAQAIARYGEES